MIGLTIFDSLTELVQYYKSNPLYRQVKLKYAINDEVLKSLEVSGCNIAKCCHNWHAQDSWPNLGSFIV